MKKSIFVLLSLQVVAFSFCANKAWAEAVSIPIGGMELMPNIILGESHDDNFLQQEKAKKSSPITFIQPSLSLKASKGANEYTLNYRLTQEIYHNSHNDDHIDHAVNLDGIFGLSRRLNAAVNVAYNKTSDPRGSIFTGKALQYRTRDLFHETILGGSVDYGENIHVIASGEYSIKRYDNHKLLTAVRDLNTTKTSLKLITAKSQRLSVVLEAKYNVYNYNKIIVNDLDSNNQRYLLGLNWEATGKTSGKARVGYLKKTFAQKTLSTPAFFSWELEATWEPLAYSIFTIATDKNTNETAGTAQFMVSTNIDASWSYAWSEYLSHHVSLGYSNDAYEIKNNPRLDKKTTVGFSMSYQMKRWLLIEPTYNYTNNKSTAAISSYKRNVWGINFVGTL